MPDALGIFIIIIISIWALYQTGKDIANTPPESPKEGKND